LGRMKGGVKEKEAGKGGKRFAKGGSTGYVYVGLKRSVGRAPDCGKKRPRQMGNLWERKLTTLVVLRKHDSLTDRGVGGEGDRGRRVKK